MRDYNTALQRDYSPGMIELNFLAPAATQSAASSLMRARITNGGALLWRNTLALRLFQMAQEVSNVREATVTNNVKMDDEDHNSVGSTGDVSAAVLVNGDSVAKDIQAKADIHFELQKKQIQVFVKFKLLF